MAAVELATGRPRSGSRGPQPAARRRGAVARDAAVRRARARSQPRLSPARQQLLGLEVDPRRDRLREEVAEHDLRRDPFGAGWPAAHLASLRVRVELRLEPLGQLVDQQRARRSRRSPASAARPSRGRCRGSGAWAAGLPFGAGQQLVHQLAPAGDVRDPLGAADLQRGDVLRAPAPPSSRRARACAGSAARRRAPAGAPRTPRARSGR